MTSRQGTVNMKHKVTLIGAVNFTKLSVCLSCTWPPLRRSKQWQSIKDDVIWCFSFVSVFCLLIPLIKSIPAYRSNAVILTKTGCSCSGCIIIITKTLIMRIHRTKLQALVEEMEKFIKSARPHERRVLQSYVDRCWIFHAFITFMNYLASITIIFGPFVFPDQRMPTVAIYPFSIDSGIAMYLMFIHQCFVGLQTSAALTVDCQMAMMMWFAGARMEILAEEIGEGFSANDFGPLVKKHQKLLSYTIQVSETMCYIALTTACLCGVASIMCCMQFVGNQPLMVKMQFTPVTIVVLINLLVCAWPTENAISMCGLIGTAVYETQWVNMSPKLTKDMIMILHCSQRPVQVSISGFLPALSLRFYASFLSSVFSYFTTIRVLLMSDDEKELAT